MVVPSLKMNNGLQIPQVGLGLWQVKHKKDCVDAINWGLEAGYRHFDDAQAYENEQFLGEAIKASKIPRKELFITTKIRTANMGNQLIETFDESIEKLRMDYVDLLLLHFPMTISRRISWPLMEEIYASGRAKSIGVSNYTVRHLEELLADSKVRPAVNQVELSVVLQQPELVEYCEQHGIVVEAYTPLSEGLFFDDPTLIEIAEKHNKSVPQVMLRWCIDYGVVALTKSIHKDRIKENVDIFDFELDAADMKKLKTLDKDHRNNWDPTHVE